MWESQIIISKNRFKCHFCGFVKTGAYKFVDGEKSCEKCNREYDYVAPKLEIKCPVCLGKGILSSNKYEDQ